MDNDETVNDDTLDIQEEEVEEVEETEEEEIDWKAEAEKAKQIAENQRIRAEKAEKKAKETKTETSTKLTTTDILALSRANIDDEDLDEVLEYANFKKISVKEALGSTILKSALAEKAEMRKSAQAVNTGATRRASGQVSDDRLLADARNGIMPKDDADLARLATLRLKRK